MNKLTAERCRYHISRLQGYVREGHCLSMIELDTLQAFQEALPVLEQQEKGTGDWIEWKGGDCPVADYEHVELRWSNNGVSRGRASNFGWENRIGQGYHSIIAYRVIESDGRED